MLGNIKRSMFITNFGWLLLAVFLLLCTGAFFALSSLPYFSAKFGPPTQITYNQLVSGNLQLPIHFASVTGDATYDTGYYYETTTQYIFKSNDYYGLLQLGDKLLLLYTDEVPDETRTEWTGTLDLTSGADHLNVVSDLQAEIAADAPDFANAILPYTLNQVETVNWTWWAGLVLLVVTALFGIFALIRALTRFTNRAEHPVWKRLMRYGNDVPAVVTAIERDMKAGSEKVGRMQMSRNWIVAPGNNFRAMRLADVVWLYQYTFVTRTNGIKTGTTHSAVFWDKYGEEVKIQGKEAKVHQMLGAVQQRAPWTVTGHSDALKNAWAKERPMFIASVEKRKQEMMAERGSAPIVVDDNPIRPA